MQVGQKHSEETRQRVSKALRGRKMPENVRQKISQALTGKKHSEASKKKMSESTKGQRHSEETKRKIAESSKGRKHTEATKNRLSELAKQRGISDETRRKISLSLKKRVGLMASQWKGGKVMIRKYRYIYFPHHPNCTKGGYVAEHRLVMEDHIGRYLTKKEVVHHLNEVPTDNHIGNLVLCPSVGIHTRDYHS